MVSRRGSLVLLVRHGKAEDTHPLGDASRPLSPDGRQAFQAHARKVASEAALEGIVTSPLLRAVQTAEILAQACGVSQVLVRAELDFGQASPATLEALARTVGPGWALVGHNPSLAETLGHLLGREDLAPRFRKGAVAAFRMTADGSLPWELAWLAAPGRKLARELE
jgi:phosphohistidine phosphatase